ncbi:hypothetical protein B0H13DRAFT_1853421 [Mycena leptocephala]|nr:hypothetical protein B0H13DRAFT_1853421 [Mycena leptocephala]
MSKRRRPHTKSPKDSDRFKPGSGICLHSLIASNILGQAYRRRKEGKPPEGRFCILWPRSHNDFANDTAYIRTRFLLRLIQGQGIVPSHLLHIRHTETGATHIIALFLMGGTSVIAVWVTIWGLSAAIISLHGWYQNPDLDVRMTEIVTLRKQTSHNIRFTATSLPGALIANPVSSRVAVATHTTPPPSTRTIPQRAVYTALNADVRSLMSGVETQEQLEALRARLQDVRRAPEEARRDRIQDPPVIARKALQKVDLVEEERGFVHLISFKGMQLQGVQFAAPAVIKVIHQ